MQFHKYLPALHACRWLTLKSLLTPSTEYRQYREEQGTSSELPIWLIYGWILIYKGVAYSYSAYYVCVCRYTYVYMYTYVSARVFVCGCEVKLLCCLLWFVELQHSNESIFQEPMFMSSCGWPISFIDFCLANHNYWPLDLIEFGIWYLIFWIHVCP